jgi:hypothetical protein
MITTDKDRLVTLDSLLDQLFRPELDTPIPQVTDYRIAAGFLVRRYMDGTRRFIDNRNKLEPVIQIEWIRKERITRKESISTTPEVVAALLSKGFVQGTPKMGSTDMNYLQMHLYTRIYVASELFPVRI